MFSNKTMKTTSALMLAIFLLAFTTTTISAVNGNLLVLDSDGHPMRNGGEYFLSPTNSGAIIGGFVRRGSDSNCSLGVVRHSGGWSTTISSPSPSKVPYIPENFPLDISFAQFAPNVCTKSQDWVVTRSFPIRLPVMLGRADFEGSVIDGYFSIASVDSAQRQYKLIFCHTGGECGNIGVVFDITKLERLVVTVDEPLVFKFDKVIKGSSDLKLSMVV